MARTKPKCSGCGATRKLYLVTVGADHHAPGRVLLYCPKCRQQGRQHLDICIPLELVSGGLFVSLYQYGFTGSAPDMSAEIVFGDAVPEGVIEEASRVLSGR